MLLSAAEWEKPLGRCFYYHCWICYGAQMWYTGMTQKRKIMLDRRGWRQTLATFFLFWAHLLHLSHVPCQELDTVYELCVMDGLNIYLWGTMSIYNLCPFSVSALLQFEAQIHQMDFKSTMRWIPATLAPPSLLHYINAANSCSPISRPTCVCMCVVVCVCLPLPSPPSSLPKCWLELFPTCWQSAQRLIYCVTVHT